MDLPAPTTTTSNRSSAVKLILYVGPLEIRDYSFKGQKADMDIHISSLWKPSPKISEEEKWLVTIA